MGMALCVPKKERRRGGGGGLGASAIGSKRLSRSMRKMPADEEIIHRQALAMAIQHQQMSQRFEGSMSRRIGNSSRRKNLPDSVINGKQVIRYHFYIPIALNYFLLLLIAYG